MGSQSDLIAQILAAIQPKINSAVQTAISSSSNTRASGFGQNSFTTSRRNYGSGSSPGSGSSSGLISSVISSLQPQISSAVNSAISGSRRVAVSRPRPSYTSGVQASTSGNLAGVFGQPGQTSVSVETPNFNINY